MHLSKACVLSILALSASAMAVPMNMDEVPRLAPEHVGPKDAVASNQAVSRENTVSQDNKASLDAVSPDTASQDATSEDAASQVGGSQDATPQDEGSQHGTSQEHAGSQKHAASFKHAAPPKHEKSQGHEKSSKDTATKGATMPKNAGAPKKAPSTNNAANVKNAAGSKAGTAPKHTTPQEQAKSEKHGKGNSQKHESSPNHANPQKQAASPKDGKHPAHAASTESKNHPASRGLVERSMDSALEKRFSPIAIILIKVIGGQLLAGAAKAGVDAAKASLEPEGSKYKDFGEARRAFTPEMAKDLWIKKNDPKVRGIACFNGPYEWAPGSQYDGPANIEFKWDVGYNVDFDCFEMFAGSTVTNKGDGGYENVAFYGVCDYNYGTYKC